ncbi:MAG: PRC-barrel domain-containing protein [Dichotomicrobium sp.]
MLRNTAAACIAALLIAVPQAQAQDQEQSQKSGEDIEFVRAIGSGEWLSSDLIGQSVNNSEGETIGDVNGLIIGDDNEVTAAVIGVGGFLGIGEKSVAVNYDAVERKKNEDGEVVLSANLTKEQLESAPEFEGSRSSDTMEQTGDAASEAGDEAMTETEQAAQEAQEMAGQAAEKAEEAAEAARQKASEQTDGESTTQN